VDTPEDRLISESERDCLSKKLGDRPGVLAKIRKEIEEMSEEDMGSEIKKTEEILRERAGATSLRSRKSGLGSLPLTMAILCLVGGQARAFTADVCSNRNNIIESYSLLEPDAFAASDKAGEVETTVYGEIVQIKQDCMILLFRCQVIETIVSQYCGHFSQLVSSGTSSSESPKPWKPGSVARRGHTEKSSSARSRPPLGPQCPTQCS
jgi:hypothetical protein